MAKLPALVTALAEVDGRDHATIDYYARVIREAGYIPTTKRGSGAAEMTAREAANLLIALCGTDSPKDAPLAIDRFRTLVRDYGWTRPKGTELPGLQAAAESTTFGEALEHLINNAPLLAGAIGFFVLQGYRDLSDKARRGLLRQALKPAGVCVPAGLSITFHRYAAEIVLWSSQRGGQEREWQTRFLADVSRLEAGFYGPQEHDRRVAVIVGLPTLLALYRALNPDTETPNTEIAGEEPEVARLGGAPGPEKEFDQ